MTSNELRRRKTSDKPARPAGAKKGRKPSKSKGYIHQSLLCLILSGILSTIVIVLYVDSIPWHMGHRALDSIAQKFGYHEPVHAIVIDAGSTGSRILAYTFHRATWGGHLILDSTLFEQTKPGLSAYADNLPAAIESIHGLIALAKKEIPEEYWSRTPIELQATAGLRLLPPAKAEALLQSCRDIFAELPFITRNDSVGIMDGVDEGIFSWFTVNFLIERFSNQPSKTVAALDLGGGSTQVTFSAVTPATLKQKSFIHHAQTPKGSTPVYTNSYLGLGLMSARHSIITKGYDDKAREIISECVNPVVKNRKFSYGGNDYFVSGLKSNYPVRTVKDDAFTEGETVPIVDHEKCAKYMIDYVRSKESPPEELQEKEIFAFSYYFDRAVAVGLIDAYKGGKIQVSDFDRVAKQACKEANTDQPFMCLDLTFISVLLEHAFKLEPSSKLHLYKKVNGHEISWALGSAYNMLHKQL